jgi:hypothetical protein
MHAASAVLLLLLLGGLRQARADGHSDCPCIGLPSTVLAVDCDEDYAFNGKCVIPPVIEWRAANGGQDAVPYPADYGSMCKKHLEPGDSQCWDLITGQELPVGSRASWCDNSWCYVDPANCDLPGSNSTSPGVEKGWETNVCAIAGTCPGHEFTPLAYSYETCGAIDKFTKQSYIGKTRDFALLLMSQFMNVLTPPLDLGPQKTVSGASGIFSIA